MFSPQPASVPAAPGPLRVYRAGEPDGLSPAMTLSQFVELYVLPRVLASRGAAERNVEQHLETLSLWVRYTGDPALQDITPAVVHVFKTAIGQRPGRNGNGRLSPNTVRKHLTALQLQLDLAGPKLIGLLGPGRRTNEQRARPDGLFGYDADGRPRPVPYVDKPPLKRKPVSDVFTIDELSRWLAACRRARVPRRLPGVSAPRWWKALILWNYNVGTRIGTTLVLRWDWLIKPTLLRIPAGVPGVKAKSEQEFYVNPVALAAAASIRTADPRMFPWRHEMNYLHKIRRQLLEAAGIPPERRFGFHGGRKCLCTELMQINPIAAQKALGHLAIGMTRDHYTGPDVVAAAMARIPQPRLPDRQLELF